MTHYDVISKNEFGRKETIRYKQYTYGGLENIKDWRIDSHGCGPTTMATILSSLGYNLTPEDIAKKMLLDEYGYPMDFYNDRTMNRLGTRDIAFIYLLQRLNEEQICNVSYKLIKLSYEHPELKKELVFDMIKNEYMAMVCVGPWKETYLKTFSNGGHYIGITSVNLQNHEFYVTNPNKLGDSQIDCTFSYETIVENMYPNCFDFLMLKDNQEKTILKRCK